MPREKRGKKSHEPPLNFATLVEFHEIIDYSKNWTHFEPHIRNAGFKDRKEFKDEFNRFNSLRNLIHGARETTPDQEDLDFAQEFSDRLSELDS